MMNDRITRIAPHTHRQSGAALIVGLLMLVVLTIIGIATMGTASMEEKMSGNSRDQTVAFQAAEAALRDGEAFVETLIDTSSFDNTCTTGLCATGTLPNVFASGTWAAGNSRTYAGGALTGASNAPRYIIEVIGTENANPEALETAYNTSSGGGVVTFFRITARGAGNSPNTYTYLQSYYGRQF